MSIDFCLSYWLIGMGMNQLNDLVLVTKWRVMMFSSVGTLLEPSLWCIWVAFCIVSHVFSSISDFFCFLSGDSEKCCIFAAWRERLIPFGTRPPFQSDGGNNYSPMYCQGSLHSITLFFFDVLSFHWHFRWMPDIQFEVDGIPLKTSSSKLPLSLYLVS